MTKDYKNLEKIVVNVGIGRLSSQPNFEDKILPQIIEELGIITGQKAMTCQAKKSIAGFKLREGTNIGLKVTLRKERMKDFLKKFVHIVLPRMRDFRGIKKEFVDARGNLTIGLKEHYSFPEVSPDISKISFGLQVTFVPKSYSSKEKAIELYNNLGIPFSASTEGRSSSGGKGGSASGGKK